MDLFHTDDMTELQKQNSELNMLELESDKTVLKAYPRRLVFELTNRCNLNCVMCGRNDAYFKPTVFDINWIDKFDHILDRVEEVTLMGWGEPTVHPEFALMLEKINKYPVRKYFCTNGMKLGELTEEIFKNKVDIVAISIDGSDEATNNSIRRGSDFQKIIESLKNIVSEKRKRKLQYPYMNFVFTAMKSNLHQIPDMVRLACDVGLDEVKVVYLTAFGENMMKESLYNCKEEVRQYFNEATKLSDELGIKLKLPYIQGEDIAGSCHHKNCYTAWRDFFLGSDGYVRPCMSTSKKLFNINDYESFEQMWNSEEYVDFRATVNDEINMDGACKYCYQSSYANWNNFTSFIQTGQDFAPKWEKS